ncbi:MAG: copper amine oxidase N-terminal domain-containing protein [Desulfotomaculaceae bacterium]|nr:copper amine oxidase N-terminal domain-containing protein [Desulfotomaculaceae bacterium]
MVETNSATALIADSATMNGRMTECYGKIKEYGFYYGTDSTTPHKFVVGVDEYVEKSFSKTVSGLKPGVYYYKAFATNNSDTGYGPIMKFIIKPAGVNDDIIVNLDGEFLTFDVQPVIFDGRTLAPIRAICEALGASVRWSGETRTVTIVKDGTEIKLVIDGDAYINNQLVSIDVPPRIINDRTLVPVRFISESMGCAVDWDNDARAVIITSYDEAAKHVQSD